MHGDGRGEGYGERPAICTDKSFVPSDGMVTVLDRMEESGLACKLLPVERDGKVAWQLLPGAMKRITLSTS